MRTPRQVRPDRGVLFDACRTAGLLQITHVLSLSIKAADDQSVLRKPRSDLNVKPVPGHLLSPRPGGSRSAADDPIDPRAGVL